VSPLRRALALRCPLCGEGRLFASWFRMVRNCSGCRFKFEREPGYFLGSIYVNYGLSVALVIVTLVTTTIWPVSTTLQVSIVAAIVAFFALWFFRYARALWLAFDVSIAPPEAQEFS
jgi:uncharacterized protein (DUF983 family)